MVMVNKASCINAVVVLLQYFTPRNSVLRGNFVVVRNSLNISLRLRSHIVHVSIYCVL